MTYTPRIEISSLCNNPFTYFGRFKSQSGKCHRTLIREQMNKAGALEMDDIYNSGKKVSTCEKLTFASVIFLLLFYALTYQVK